VSVECDMPVTFTSARFVGRERELSRLAVALDRAAEGHSTTLLLAGTGGIGSSRLLTETERRLGGLAEPFTVIRGRPTAAERARPYGQLIAGMTPVLADLSDLELQEVLGPGVDELSPLFPTLVPRLARLGHRAEQRSATAPERRQARVMERVLGVLAALGERRPVLLAFDDLHAVDGATRNLVSFLARISRPQRLAIIGTYQPDEMTRVHPFHGDLAAMADTRRPAERVDLGPFGADELADLVEGIEGERPSGSLLLLVAERSQGNPLIAEELLAARREEGGALLAGSLAVLVLARLGRRSPECRRLLRLLAIAEGPLTRSELATIAVNVEAGTVRRPPRSVSAPRRADGDLDPDLVAGIAEADEHGWLATSTTTDGDEAIALRHELIARAVAADLLPVQRRRHLAAVAAAMRDSPAAATRYWLAAWDVGRARAAALEAAELAEAIHAPQDALDLLERVLELSDPVGSTVDLASGETASEGQAGLQARAAEAAFAAGRPLRAAAFAESAIARVDERTERIRVGLLYERLGRYRRAAGDPVGALAAHRRAVDLVPPEPSRERALVLASLAQLRMLEGTFSEAERYGEEAIAVARAVGPEARGEEAHALTTVGVSMGWGDNPEEAVALLNESRSIAAERGDLDELFRVIANLTTVLDLVGRRTEAAEIAYEGIAEARRVGLEAVYGNFLRANAADSLFLLGRWAESRELSERALEWTPMGVNSVSFVNAIVNLAIVEIESASGELASRLLGQLLVEAEAAPDAQFAVPIFQAAASHALWRADLADAQRACSIGWASARRTEDWVLIARMAATALEVDAAIVADARERRDLPAVAAARERSAAILADAEATVARSGVPAHIGSRRTADAAVAAARAFRQRLDGRDEPAAWASLADRWEALDERYQVARARWRQAESILGSMDDARVDRAEARGPLLEAYSIGRELGAMPLLRELGELAARALISLPSVVEAQTAPDARVPAGAVAGRLAGSSERGGVAIADPPPGRAASEASAEGWSSGWRSGGGDGDGRGGRGPARFGESLGGPPVSAQPTEASALVRGFVGQPAPRRTDPFGLSPREREVLLLISQGRTNREIGERLFISQKTVGVHVGNILAKLDVSGRVEAAAVAIRLGLTDRR
jgi:DNA-binding CsgD family transcriptional regulator/tetratricopeptide (TPR) repeat protein